MNNQLFTTSRCLVKNRKMYAWPKKNELPERVYNLGGAEDITIEKLSDIVILYCKYNKIECKVERVPLADNDINHSVADISLAERDLDFHPQVNEFEKRLVKILDKELKGENYAIRNL